MHSYYLRLFLEYGLKMQLTKWNENIQTKTLFNFLKNCRKFKNLTWDWYTLLPFSTIKMGSRSKSRERERHRSRSPTSRSKSHKDERRGKSHYVKKEPDDDHGKARRREPEIRVKSEPTENVKKGFSSSQTERENDKKAFGSSQTEKDEPGKEPEKPSMALSGKLMEDTNVFNGVVIK